MLEKLKTLYWFLLRPRFWVHSVTLVARKVLPDYDSQKIRSSSTEWAMKKAVPLTEAIHGLGLTHEVSLQRMPIEIISEAKILANKSIVTMGGPGALDLLYALTKSLKPKYIVETGVAYGWSSLSFLSAIDNLPESRLISVDMPYPKVNNEPWVGIVVSNRFRKQWTLIKEPDRYGLIRALKIAGGPIDICHYDSDKSYWGRKWAYPKLWKSLKSGGIFVSDDIQDNFAFKEFTEETGALFCIIESQGKYVGIIVKK